MGQGLAAPPRKNKTRQKGTFIMSKHNGKDQRVWFITGTSHGFGRELVRAVLDRGDKVVATSRDPSQVASAFGSTPDRLLAIPLDLRDEGQITAKIAEAVRHFGRIDVLVNNAGHGLLGAVEEATDEEVRNVFETNVFGLLRVTRAILPYLRKQRGGHIVNLSSIGGLAAWPGWGIYSATKFAVEGLSEALAMEVEPLGIHVTIVEPGPFRTGFLGTELPVARRIISDYDETAGRTRNWRNENDGAQQGDPVRGAQAIVDTITSANPPRHLLLGADAYDRAMKKLDLLRDEFEAWHDVAFSTDFAVQE
jgi:NAD(P)-dependent dehydrogenase (short-subunit alcohol dehydrogenase family)